MSYPDPPPPPHPFISPPYYYDDNAGGFRPQVPINRGNLDSYSFDQQPPFKRPRNFEDNSPNSVPPAPLSSRANLPIPSMNRGTTHLFYKTRMCLKFMEGNCRNGDTCTYAHGPEDLRKPPPNWHELVKGDQNIKYGVKICKKFYNGEECPYGEKCHFLHESPAKLGTDMAVETSMARRGQSSVSSGAMGAMEHRKICSKWEVGLCPFGDRCHFAHGESDLQVPNESMNTAGSVAENPSAVVTTIDVPPTIPVIATNGTEGIKVKKGFAKWGPNKKINKIYGDWIDDLSPPRS